ncbi:MAG: hypothetical protein M3292_10895, partial [Actinomycetota bacterium]|nr:hypothetical protein [Actinomycetota bacterium]
MKTKLLSVAAALVALALAPAAAAADGNGGFQAVAQAAKTAQIAAANALSDQQAANANVPVTIAGKDASSGQSSSSGESSGSGQSSATQDADSTAVAAANNTAATNQLAKADQNVGGSSSCKAGCGGSGGFQAVSQQAKTAQLANANATS